MFEGIQEFSLRRMVSNLRAQFKCVRAPSGVKVSQTSSFHLHVTGGISIE